MKKLTNVLTIEELKQQKETLFNVYASVWNAKFYAKSVEEKDNLKLALDLVAKEISNIDLKIIELESEGK